ncbi:hypothetical protein [Nocardia sp. NPDC052566]|uniref:hypothetical protein n=1 Tax=Nocardia sp. NPDC052566 TaxID=3364330 RepID=UPI0037C879A5
MPSQLHEVLTEMFRDHPTLAAGLLTEAFGIAVPAYQQAHASSCDFTDVGPKEFRGDTALVFADETGTVVLGIVVEIQLCRDPSRHWKWPVYVSTLRARLECPAYLVVVCPDSGIAAWCRSPIELGHPGLVLNPLVLGPDAIPIVTDPAVARAEPERAVLSSLAHGEGPQADDVFGALLAGLSSTDDERAKLYYDLVAASLSAAARHRLEELMASTFKYEYQSDFARKYVAQGRAEGRVVEAARAVLNVLEARGLAISEDTRDQITGCTDIEQLEAWHRRAVVIEAVANLFD